MESVWYYVRSGAQAGPVSFDELKALAASGKLAPTDLVWKEGTADWVPARTVADLFVGPPPPPRGTSGEPLPLSLDDAHPLDRGPGVDLVALAQEFFQRTAATNPAAIKPSAAEEALLTRAGVLDPVARRYAVWRRAVLWVSVLPTSFAALLGLINAIALDKSETEHLSNFGILLLYLQAFALFALPVAAVVGANVYQQLSASARWVFMGGMVSLLVPLCVALVPASILLDVKASRDEDAATMNAIGGFVLGIQFYLILMPSVLSLLPAVSRACLRVKVFLPQSLVPGWGLVSSVPLFALLTLATLILLYHIAGNFLLIIGLLLWIGAPLLYLNQFQLLTRPVIEKRELKALAKSQAMVLGMIAAGVLLLIIYMFTAKFAGMTLLGFDKKDSILRPWSLELHKKWLEYVGRSLFLTVLFADLLMRMSLSVWREERAFAGTPAAAEFDRTMSGMSDAIEAKRGEPLP